MIVFEDGTRVSLREALDKKLIGIDDLMLNGLSVIISPKNDDSLVTIQDEIGTFSYEHDWGLYGEAWGGGLGMFGRQGTYINTEPNPITTKENAINLARNEVNQYFIHDTIKAYYDDVLEMWKVVFFKEHMLGGCLSVYMSSDGITQLRVFGE